MGGYPSFFMIPFSSEALFMVRECGALEGSSPNVTMNDLIDGIDGIDGTGKWKIKTIVLSQ